MKIATHETHANREISGLGGNVGVKIHIHASHRQHTDGMKTVTVQGDTVGSCLSNLTERFPGMNRQVFDTKGQLRNNLEIYLNQESAYPDELSRPVQDGDEIHLTLILTGG